MAATRTFTANFVGRTSNLEKSFKRVSKGSSLMSDNLMRTTRMAGIGFAALGGVVIGAAAALKPMIDKAASMEEALSKNQLLLGESSKAVEAFAETSLESFGVTNLAALQATGVFANLGKAMKLSEADSASMATTLTGLAGDLSSLHDVSVEEALTALRAGLIGEAEPLRKFGIFLDAATLKTKALQMGLIKNTKEALTPGIKSQAAYAFILQESTAAMGDFTRTADSATNVSKQLAGQWEELQIVIGTALLPSFTALVTHLVDVVMPAITDFFEDPSWTAGGLLMGQAVLSGFVTGLTGITLALVTGFLNPVGAAFGIALDLLDPFGGGDDDGAVDPAMRGGPFGDVAAQFGRNNPDWDRSGGDDGAVDPATSAFTSGGGPDLAAMAAEAVAAAVAAAATMPGPVADQLAAAVAVPVDDPAFSPDAGPTAEQLGATTGPTDAEVAAWLSSPGAQALFAAGPSVSQLTSGGGTTININSTAVSGQELVEELGKYIDMNGPLGPQFISQ